MPSTVRLMSYGSICSQNCQKKLFYFLDICYIAITIIPAKNIDIALAITLVKTN